MYFNKLAHMETLMPLTKYMFCIGSVAVLWLYLTGHHQLHQSSRGAQDVHSLLMSQTHQRLTVNHEQLIANVQTAVPSTQERKDCVRQ